MIKLYKWQKISNFHFIVFLYFAVFTYIVVAQDIKVGLTFFLFSFQILYFLITYYKGALFLASFFNKQKKVTQTSDLKHYPTFDILLANYKEKEKTLQQLVNNVAKLEYPKEKMTGFLIVQEDDVTTLNSIKNLTIPDFIRVFVIPPVQPGEMQSKSRALNYAIKQCNSDILTIFDSEDEPDIYQLQKVARQFEQGNASVIQCNIDIYNSKQNFIARFFSAEFRCFFQFLLKGISVFSSSNSSAYLPLGGTSFYVKKQMMDKIGEFDMFNPTEDLIFSSSVYKHGGIIEHNDSITYGEAPVKFKQLINQRTRWVKGFMISTLLLNANIVKTCKEIGVGRWFTFNMWTLGSFFGLSAPFMFLFSFIWVFSSDEIYKALFPEWLWNFGFGGLLVGGGIISIVIFAIPAVFNKRYIDVILTPIFMIFSNVILMISAYKALHQLITKPNMGWVKTEHGLAEKDFVLSTT